MQRPEFAEVTPLKVEHYPRGQAAANVVPGDFILVHGHSFISGLIRLGEALRIHGADRTYAYWNHAALVVTGDGGLIEATGRGVQRANLADYSQSDYQLVRIDATEADRE